MWENLAKLSRFLSHVPNSVVYSLTDLNGESEGRLNSILPDSAISSWGGFVYQGKVALYHSIILLIDKSFKNIPVSDFKLQLDSTDDFAIYVGGVAISVHQVKAKITTYRSSFLTALNKSSLINTDCNSSTKRYFHIASAVDDDSDYVSTNNTVEFYTYGEKSYCELDEIEVLTKNKISEYLEKYNLPSSPKLIDRKHCAMSELITAHVLKIHAQIHSGDSQNNAAYKQVIDSFLLENLIQADYESEFDNIYHLKNLRLIFANTFEGYVAENNHFSQNQINILGIVLRFVYEMSDSELLSVMHSLLPSERSKEVRGDDIQNYIDIISEISREIILTGLPHYFKNSSRYIPTSLRLSNKRTEHFKENLINQIRANPKLANILFEYNTLITGNDDYEKIIAIGQSDKITTIVNEHEIKNNIVREFPISVISVKIAKGELDA